MLSTRTTSSRAGSSSKPNARAVPAPGRHEPDGALGEPRPKHLAGHDSEGISGDHAEGGPQPDSRRIALARQRDGGELGLVAEFGDEERDGDDAKGAEPGAPFHPFVVAERVTADAPGGEDEEGEPDDGEEDTLREQVFERYPDGD